MRGQGPDRCVDRGNALLPGQGAAVRCHRVGHYTNASAHQRANLAEVATVRAITSRWQRRVAPRSTPSALSLTRALLPGLLLQPPVTTA